MRRSIRLRLIVWVLALVLPLSAGAAWLLVQLFGNRMLRDVDVALQEEAETVGELLDTHAGPNEVARLLSAISGEKDLGPRKYIVATRDGAVIAEMPPGAAAFVGSNPAGLRVARYQSPAAGESTAVSIGVSAATAVQARQRLSSLLSIGTPALLVLVAAGLWLVIGRALRPLEQAARQLDRVAADTLWLRLPATDAGDEVGRIVSVVNRMLERLEHAVGQLQRFTAEAAHELRTPLTVLRSGLEVALTRDRSPVEYRATLSEALTSTDRLCRLAEDLLTLARLDASSAPRAGELVDVGGMLFELAEAQENLAASCGMRIETVVTRGLLVRGSATDLYRLFSNLIENAARHGGSGGLIAVAARQLEGRVEVTVADRGGGIAPDELDRVFDRFYRASSRRRKSGGTGLGLSIAAEIARIHGGEIDVGNREGGGCVATVTLPAVGSH